MIIQFCTIHFLTFNCYLVLWYKKRTTFVSLFTEKNLKNNKPEDFIMELSRT